MTSTEAHRAATLDGQDISPCDDCLLFDLDFPFVKARKAIQDATVRSRCVVIGGGFGGLQAVKTLRRANLDVTLIDRHNYHLFQPLSYQVATGALSPGEIAVPLRHIFRNDRRVQVLMGEVTGFDLESRTVTLTSAAADGATREVPYDTLIVAGGSSYSYFGHDQWRSTALEVKSLDSALQVRGRIFEAFEVAELERDPKKRASCLTFVVIGAGPTGVEMAGQIAELAHNTLPAEFRHIDPSSGKVLLIETADRVLTGFTPSQSLRAVRSLERLGVRPLLSHTVVDVHHDGVVVKAANGSTMRIMARTVVWAAGVTASPLARVLGEACGAEVDNNGRVVVQSDLTLPGHPEVLAIGDMVRVEDSKTKEPQNLPGLAPVAMQQGRYAGRLVADRIKGRSTPPFHYRDKGTLATIGRARAVADIHGIRLSGSAAWLLWLTVHLFYMIGFENRFLVLQQWVYIFLTRRRSSRLITEATEIGPR